MIHSPRGPALAMKHFLTVLVLFTTLSTWSGDRARAAAPEAGSAQIVPGWAHLSAILPEGVDLTGHAVYLDFWASWCPPCRKSFPWMTETARRFGPQGLEVIAVCMDKDPKKAEKFLSEQGKVPFRIAYDPKGDVAKQYDLKGMPTSLLFAPDGSLVSRHEGFLAKDADALLDELTRLYPEAAGVEGQSQP